jgi:hypothetical protein
MAKMHRRTGLEKPTALDVASPAFPVPRSARTWELIIHAECADRLIARSREAELADAG